MGTPLYPLQIRLKIEELNDEIDAIHYDNALYWRNPNHGPESATSYASRCNRLKLIREQLADIAKTYKITE